VEILLWYTLWYTLVGIPLWYTPMVHPMYTLYIPYGTPYVHPVYTLGGVYMPSLPYLGCTRVGSTCIPTIPRGVPGRVVPPYHTQGVPWWVYIPPYYTSLYHPGYTLLLPPVSQRAPCPVQAWWVYREEALGSKERNPLGESLFCTSGCYSCRVWYTSAHRMLCSLTDKWMKDWIATGTSPYYTLW